MPFSFLPDTGILDLAPGSSDCEVHAQVVEPLSELVRQASFSGIDLRVASAYRDIDRQCLIWNRKARGERPVYSLSGDRVIDVDKMDEWQLARAIMRWSAVPGLSRHHWGTDIDVYDAAAVDADYELQLSPGEYATDGVFHHLTRWLDERIGTDNACGFFRPYAEDRGGVAPEPWHLSYAPLAAEIQSSITVDQLRDGLRDLVLELGGSLLSHMDEIYAQFFWVPAAAYPRVFQPALLAVEQR